MNAAEVTFREVTRAAYAAFVSSPPVIAYRLTVREKDSYYERNIRYEIVYDTRTGIAHRRDLVYGDRADEHPFMAAPNLDPIGSFISRVTTQRAGVSFTAYEVQPLNLPPPTPPPTHSDAWTAANGAYVPRFDPEDTSTTTLLLVPTDRYRAEHRAWTLSRLRFDPATKLPTRVEMTSPEGGRFVLEYHTVAGHHLVSSVVFDDDAQLILTGSTGRGREHIHFDGVYDQYAFPAPGPDARASPSKP